MNNITDTPMISGEFFITENPQPPVVYTTTKNDEYFILNTPYSQDVPCDESLKYSSAVFGKNGTLLSVAPQIAIPLVMFAEKYPELTDDIDVVCMTEGTLIQLFYDTTAEPNRWEIATRSNISGDYWHFRTEYKEGMLCTQKTFRQMFYDAIENCALVGTLDEVIEADFMGKSTTTYNSTIPDYDSPLMANPFIRKLDKTICYHFVLKHQANPMVHLTWSPSVTLVSAYKLSSTETAGEHRVSIIHPASLPFLIPASFRHIIRIQTSARTQWSRDTFINTMQTYTYMAQQPGVMFVNIKTGERAVLENPAYAQSSELRGNHPNLFYQFMELHRNGRLIEFTRRFPWFEQLFMAFSCSYRDFVSNVYDAYYRHFIRREFADHRYHRHAIKIHHNVYLPSVVSGRKVYITMQVVHAYFDNLSISQVLHAMNSSAEDAVLDSFTYEYGSQSEV